MQSTGILESAVVNLRLVEKAPSEGQMRLMKRFSVELSNGAASIINAHDRQKVSETNCFGARCNDANFDNVVSHY